MSLKPSDMLTAAEDQKQRLAAIQEQIQADSDQAPKVEAGEEKATEEKATYSIPELVEQAILVLSQADQRRLRTSLQKAAVWLLRRGLARFRQLEHVGVISEVQRRAMRLPVPSPALVPDTWSYRLSLGDVTRLTLRGLSPTTLAQVHELRRGLSFPANGGASVVVALALIIGLDDVPLEGSLSPQLRVACNTFLEKLDGRAVEATRLMAKIQRAEEEHAAMVKAHGPMPAPAPRVWGAHVIEEED